MKIRQCFLKLQLKMSGMFILRHTVDAIPFIPVTANNVATKDYLQNGRMFTTDLTSYVTRLSQSQNDLKLSEIL